MQKMSAAQRAAPSLINNETSPRDYVWVWEGTEGVFSFSFYSTPRPFCVSVKKSSASRDSRLPQPSALRPPPSHLTTLRLHYCLASTRDGHHGPALGHPWASPGLALPAHPQRQQWRIHPKSRDVSPPRPAWRPPNEASESDILGRKLGLFSAGDVNRMHYAQRPSGPAASSESKGNWKFPHRKKTKSVRSVVLETASL